MAAGRSVRTSCRRSIPDQDTHQAVPTWTWTRTSWRFVFCVRAARASEGAERHARQVRAPLPATWRVRRIAVREPRRAALSPDGAGRPGTPTRRRHCPRSVSCDGRVLPLTPTRMTGFDRDVVAGPRSSSPCFHGRCGRHPVRQAPTPRALRQLVVGFRGSYLPAGLAVRHLGFLTSLSTRPGPTQCVHHSGEAWGAGRGSAGAPVRPGACRAFSGAAPPWLGRRRGGHHE